MAMPRRKTKMVERSRTRVYGVNNVLIPTAIDGITMGGGKEGKECLCSLGWVER